MLTIHLVRHGDTAQAAEGIFCGDLDPPLTEHGLAQAERLAQAGRRARTQRALLQPEAPRPADGRAHRARVRPRAHPRSRPARDRLRQMGGAQGERNPRERARRATPPGTPIPALVSPPGGETAFDIAARALPVVERVRERHKGHVMLVSHKATVRVIVCALLGMPLQRFRTHMACPTASITQLRVRRRGPAARRVWPTCTTSDDLPSERPARANGCKVTDGRQRRPECQSGRRGLKKEAFDFTEGPRRWQIGRPCRRALRRKACACGRGGLARRRRRSRAPRWPCWRRAARWRFSGVRAASAGALGVVRERTTVLDALHAPDLLAVRAADPTGEQARLAVDGRDDTVWTGRAGETQWRWAAAFAQPVHLGLLRARFGSSATSGVPTVFRWEVRAPREARPRPDVQRCSRRTTRRRHGSPLEGADSVGAAGDLAAQPSRRSWFVDADACALRLVVDRTNAGPPVLREVQAIESAATSCASGDASDDGAYPGMSAGGAIDGTYARRWAGAPGKSRWTLRVDLARAAAHRPRAPRARLRRDERAARRRRPQLRHRLGAGALHARGERGRASASSRSPASRCAPTGRSCRCAGASSRCSSPARVRALRLVMTGATGASGLPEPGAVPVVREIAAYRADDTRPILATPWILSVNANPSAESRDTPGRRGDQRRVPREVPAGALRPTPAGAAARRSLRPLARAPRRAARRAAERRGGRGARVDRGRRSAARRAVPRAEQPAAHRRAERLERLGLRAPRRGRTRRTRSAGTGIRCATRASAAWASSRPAVRHRVAPFLGLLRRRADLGAARGASAPTRLARGRPAPHRSGAAAHERPPDPRLRAADRRRARVAHRPAPAAREDPVRPERPAVRRPLRARCAARRRRRCPSRTPTPSGPTRSCPAGRWSASRCVATSAFCAPGRRRRRPARRRLPQPERARAGATPCPRRFARAAALAGHRRAVSRRAAGLRERRPRAIRPSRSPTRACSSRRPTSRWSTRT